MTGGLGCGKSEVASLLIGHGLAVRDADVIARDLLEPGTGVHREVLEWFGPAVADDQGRIRREIVADRIFSDPAMRHRLEALVHPAVFDLLDQWFAEVTRGGAPAVAVVPLLFEAGREGWVDRILCVAASPEVALERVVARGMRRADAERRMAAQWPIQEKAERSHTTIWNNGTREDLGRAVEAWIQQLQKETGCDVGAA